MNRAVAALAVATTLSVAVPDQCQKVNLKLKNGQDMRGDADADYYLVALLYAWCGYCRMQANAMADLYYNPKYGMDDNDRSKIQFVLINDDGAASDFERLELSGQYQGKFLPALNDDDNSSLMNAISGGKQWPKDDMAILDREGRMIQYFDSSQSGMSNRANNKIKTAVEKILSDDYKNPCVADESKEESKDESKDESVDDSKDSKEEMSPMDELRASCLLNCTGCKGKMKKGKCQLKKKLKCKFMLTKELCTQAKCKYKAPRGNKKAKCKGKGIF